MFYARFLLKIVSLTIHSVIETFPLNLCKPVEARKKKVIRIHLDTELESRSYSMFCCIRRDHAGIQKPYFLNLLTRREQSEAWPVASLDCNMFGSSRDACLTHPWAPWLFQPSFWQEEKGKRERQHFFSLFPMSYRPKMQKCLSLLRIL